MPADLASSRPRFSLSHPAALPIPDPAPVKYEIHQRDEEKCLPSPLAWFGARQSQRARNARQAREKLLAEFTPRELDVLGLLAHGNYTATMATSIGIAPHTIEWHVSHVIEKLGVHSKLQAVIAAAARMGLIEL